MKKKITLKAAITAFEKPVIYRGIKIEPIIGKRSKISRAIRDDLIKQFGSGEGEWLVGQKDYYCLLQGWKAQGTPGCKKCLLNNSCDPSSEYWTKKDKELDKGVKKRRNKKSAKKSK